MMEKYIYGSELRAYEVAAEVLYRKGIIDSAEIDRTDMHASCGTIRFQDGLIESIAQPINRTQPKPSFSSHEEADKFLLFAAELIINVKGLKPQKS